MYRSKINLCCTGMVLIFKYFCIDTSFLYKFFSIHIYCPHFHFLFQPAVLKYFELK